MGQRAPVNSSQGSAAAASNLIGPGISSKTSCQICPQTGIKSNKVTCVEKPAGLDPLLILQERENRVTTRIALRMEQLNSLPTNMPEDLRTHVQIELRMLRVLNLQRQLRSEVLACTRKDTTLESAVDIKDYRRTKKQGLREARATEKLERQQRLEIERKRKQTHQVIKFLTLYLGYY